MMEKRKLLKWVLSYTPKYSWRVAGIKDFDDFPIPFRCVASNLITGIQHIFKSGDLMTALRASMAIPSVFTPVLVDSMYLVDGGVLNNFPVDVCREMGADIIIGVNVSSGDHPKIEDLNSIVKVLITAAMLGSNKEIVGAVKNTDLLISPYLKPYTTSIFSFAAEIIKRGEEAGEKYYPEIKALADSINRLGPPPGPAEKLSNPPESYLKDLIFHDVKKITPNFITANLHFDKGDTVTVDQVDQGLDKLIGTRFVEKATYILNKVDDGYVMDMYIKEMNPYKVSFSLQYDNVFQAGLTTNITARNFLINNSKWSFTVDISPSPRVEGDFYKSFGKNGRSAFLLGGNFEKTIWPIYLLSGHEFGSFNFFRSGAYTGYNYSFNTRNYLTATFGWQNIVLHSGTGINEIFDNDISSFGDGLILTALRYEYNSFDSRYFVNSGSSFSVSTSFNIHAYEIYNGDADSKDLIEEAILIPDKNYFKFYIIYKHYFPLTKKNGFGDRPKRKYDHSRGSVSRPYIHRRNNDECQER